MSGSDTNTVYWDTCIFYALLNGEGQHGDGILDAIRADYASFKSGKLCILTSTLTVAEVSAGKISEESLEEFKSLRFATGFDFIAPRYPVVELASKLRDYYFHNPLGDSGQYNRLNLGDAVHIATAIVHEVSRFITLDKRNKPKTGEIGLLKLGDVIANEYPLQIMAPQPPPQIGMNYGIDFSER